jgi:uncharacterized protein with HEPN domain
MRRTYVRQSSETIAATPQLVSFCDAINVLAHEYMGVDPVLVWDTVQNHLEALQQALEAILSEI